MRITESLRPRAAALLWDCEAERLRGSQVHNQLESGRLLDGQIAGVGHLGATHGSYQRGSGGSTPKDPDSDCPAAKVSPSGIRRSLAGPVLSSFRLPATASPATTRPVDPVGCAPSAAWSETDRTSGPRASRSRRA